MSKILENKQIIHIATEIVALMGIIFYFSSKNKKLLSHIEDLSQRLEEQEDLIQKHEKIIKQLVQIVNKNGTVQHTQPTQPTQPTQQSSTPVAHPVVRSKTKNIQKSKPLNEKNTTQSKNNNNRPLVSFNDNEEVEEKFTPKEQLQEQLSDDDDDSELDAEIADELDELEELQEDDGLKKKN